MAIAVVDRFKQCMYCMYCPPEQNSGRCGEGTVSGGLTVS